MNKNMNNDSYLIFAKKLALRAGDTMLSYFKQGVDSTIKQDKSIVTKADVEINEMVIAEVVKSFPTHSIFGEEKKLHKNSDMVWVCDPIDGTIPFSKGIPISVFSLALVQDGEPLLGVVYDPFMKRMYGAIKGFGAYLNDKKIFVSDISSHEMPSADLEWRAQADYNLSDCINGLSFDLKLDMFQIGTIAGSACMIAAGQLEASIFAGGKGKCVDVAAVKVIVEEAGGIVTDLYGNDQRYDGDIRGVVLANKKIHGDIIAYLKNKI